MPTADKFTPKKKRALILLLIKDSLRFQGEEIEVRSLAGLGFCITLAHFLALFLLAATNRMKS
jgi:hypothetical protein